MRDFFKDVADDYENLLYHHPIKKWFFLKKNEQVSEKLDGFQGIALDAGCGTGFYGVMLKNAKMVVGTDCSMAMIHKGVSKATPNMNFLLGDCLKLPVRSNSVDLVLSFGVLGEITDWDQKLLLIHEFTRVLKPDGRFIIDYPRKTLLQFLSILIWWMKSKLFWHNLEGFSSLQSRNVFLPKKKLINLFALDNLSLLTASKVGYGLWWLFEGEKSRRKLSG